MSSYDVYFQAAKNVESILTETLEATGRGLHEKVDSVKNKLSAIEIRALRAVATVRNNLAHSNSFNPDSVPDDFLQVCAELTDCIKKRTSGDASATSAIVAIEAERTVRETAEEYDWNLFEFIQNLKSAGVKASRPEDRFSDDDMALYVAWLKYDTQRLNQRLGR